jgi:hypothetical protein
VTNLNVDHILTGTLLPELAEFDRFELSRPRK